MIGRSFPGVWENGAKNAFVAIFPFWEGFMQSGENKNLAAIKKKEKNARKECSLRALRVSKEQTSSMCEGFGQAFLKACAVEGAKPSSRSAEREKLQSAFLF